VGLNKSIREKGTQENYSFFGKKIMKKEEVSRVKDITKHYRFLLSELCLDYNSICRVGKFEYEINFIYFIINLILLFYLIN
jgi:hypothetical protein